MICVLLVATKVSTAAELDRVSESLGVAAVYIQDMKEHRRHNYAFSWQRMLNLNGDTGVFIQYTHARLYRSEPLGSRLPTGVASTGARAPLDFQLFNFSGHFGAAQTLTFHSMWLRIQ